MRQPLGSAGHMFWLLNQKSPVHFAVCAQVGGTTAVDSWRHALDMVQQRHPNFSVRIALDETANPYYQSVASARIPLRIVAGGDLRWEPEIERELATPFDTEQAPLVRAVLLHQRHRAVLILVSHHSIADGRSLVFAIRDTLHALSGKLLAPPPPVASLDAWFASLPEGIEDETSDQDPVQEATAKCFVFRKHDGSGPLVTRRTLTSAATEELRQRSRREGTTIQCAVVTAAAEAARQVSSALEGVTIRISSPIDFRQVVGAEDQVAPLGAGVMIPMKPQTHATFWDAARFAKRIVDRARTPSALANIVGQVGPFMSSRPGVEDVAAFWSRRLGYDLNVSNLGEVPIENCIGDLRLEALGGPSILIGFEGEQGIGVATANGSLTLLHASFEPLPSLLESMEQLLIEACS
jgi:NRPS condensation-like uncharacterized protein